MKRIFLPFVLLGIVFAGTPSAQETDDSEVGTTPDASSTVMDADNPGMGLLDQATEAKLRASTVLDISRVIALCQSAKKAGLAGENLKYCNQLLASSQLQRGLFFAQSLLGRPNVRPDDWQEIRRRALADLVEAVDAIKDQPAAYLRIAQLNLLPEGNENTAKENLKLAIQYAKNEPVILLQAVRELTNLEPEPEKREAILATAAKSGDPQITLLHALTLFELKRGDEALQILQKLVDAESGNTDLHERVIGLLIEFKEFKSAMSILDSLRAKETDGEQQHSIDLQKAKIFAGTGQYDEALKLLNALSTRSRGNVGLTLETLCQRADTHMMMDNLDEALKDIEAAEKLRPSEIAMLAILRQKYSILIEMEKYDDALAVVRKLQSTDTSPRPLYLLWEIRTLTELEKFDDAIDVTKKLQEQSPENKSLGTVELIGIYTKQKAYDKAMELVETELKEEPEDLRWIVTKTQVLAAQKKWDETVNWLESQLQKNPDSERLTLVLISILADQKNYRAAREQIKTLLAKQPDNVDLLRIDSQMLISLGLHSEAVKMLTKVIEADPTDATSINNLAWLLCTSPIDSVRNGRRAVELAEKAAEMTQYKRAFILSTLAAAHAEANDFDKAREWSQKSMDVAKTEKEKGKTEEDRQEMLEHLQKEWDCYKQNQPFRELMEDGKK